ncbi:sushi domain-containing protein 1 isoform X7 [Salvelinus fontinalis]|uniref:sushi domain-containing protein 1 isoform X7 n=1 Tax=Salvelinus fontinalis TaxID=8038 RepID=UPI00248548E6|nr:sushi domain-containing protein 1 isoform X7 [Salvelinus fontinalis]
MYWRTALVILAFLTHAITEMRVTGQTLDVCATCHPNATCEEKVDGTGKACNCMYGFVGNGRTYCQDKNECQIGANKICGQHTACHNTYGSYYCTCLAGYSPSNNMAIFIPNDGTRCQDINECRVQGICGEGGKCTNMQGYFNCLCQVGYQVHNGAEPFHPHQDKALCKAIDCGQPPSALNAVQLSATGTRYGSIAKFGCSEGFFWKSGENSSVCGAESVWKGPSLVCEAIDCGQPPSALNAVQLSATGTRYGSIAKFCCSEGFFWKSGENSSVCGAESVWKGPSLVCEATCGPAPALANTEVMLQNTSVVFHRCLEGFHSWRGRNTSVCDITGKWQAATMRCREIKPAISDLVVFNEKCLRWKADKYEEDTENYRVAFVGFRAYQRSFHDKRKKLLSSTSDHPEICLNLLPVTNYTISITALSARFTSTLTTNTSLQVPQAPEILYREIEAPLPTLWLRRSADTLDPISFYQVFVLPLEGTLVFDCSSPKTPDFSSQRKPHGQYITAQLHLRDIGKEINLTLGDGHYYGGFYNAPLQKGRDYYIILRAVSQWGGAFKHSCVIWAKVRDISYIMKVSSLFAGGSIGVFALAIFLGHCYTWFCKKT